MYNIIATLIWKLPNLPAPGMNATGTDTFSGSRDVADDAASERRKVHKSWMYSEQSSPALLYALGASPDLTQPAKPAESVSDAETAASDDDTARAPDQNR